MGIIKTDNTGDSPNDAPDKRGPGNQDNLGSTGTDQPNKNQDPNDMHVDVARGTAGSRAVTPGSQNKESGGQTQLTQDQQKTLQQLQQTKNRTPEQEKTLQQLQQLQKQQQQGGKPGEGEQLSDQDKLFQQAQEKRAQLQSNAGNFAPGSSGHDQVQAQMRELDASQNRLAKDPNDEAAQQALRKIIAS